MASRKRQGTAQRGLNRHSADSATAIDHPKGCDDDGKTITPGGRQPVPGEA